MSSKENTTPGVNVSSLFDHTSQYIGEIIERDEQNISEEEKSARIHHAWKDLPRPLQSRYRLRLEQIQDKQKFLDAAKDNLCEEELKIKQDQINQSREQLHEDILQVKETIFDEKTGLITVDYTKRFMTEHLANLIENNEGEMVNNVCFLFVDLKKLKECNIALGISAADDRLRTLGRIFIDVCNFLDDSHDAVYPLSDDSENENQFLMSFFPEGTPEFDTLQALKQEGVKITPSRKGSSGDEFLFIIKYDHYSILLRDMTNSLISHMFNSISISPHTSEIIIKDSDKKIDIDKVDNDKNSPINQYSKWCDCLNDLSYFSVNKIYKNDNSLLDRDIVISNIGVEKNEAVVFFYNALRKYFRQHQENNTSYYQQIFLEKSQISFDYSDILYDNGSYPNLSDASLMFFFGWDTYGNVFTKNGDKMDEPYGIYKKNGQFNREKINIVLPKIKKDFITAADQKPHIDRNALLRQSISKYIISEYFEEMFNLLESNGKKDKINSDLIDACNGDIKKILSVGSLKYANRDIHTFDYDRNNPTQKFEFAQRLFDQFSRRYETEIRKPELQQDQYFIEFFQSLLKQDSIPKDSEDTEKFKKSVSQIFSQ